MSNSTPATPAPNRHIDKAATLKALKFFKIAAFIVGFGLLVLVAEIVLHYGFHNDALAWWPQPHGLLFLIYVGATLNLGFKARWGLGRMVGVVAAGCVPFLSFYIERVVSKQVERELVGL